MSDVDVDDVFNKAVEPFTRSEDIEKRFYLTRNALEWWSTKGFSVRSLNTNFARQNDRYINGKIYKESVDFAFQGRLEPFFSYPSTQWIIEKMYKKKKVTPEHLKTNLNQIKRQVLLFFQMILGGKDKKGGTALLFIVGDIPMQPEVKSVQPEVKSVKPKIPRTTIPLAEKLANFYLFARYIFLRETIKDETEDKIGIITASKRIAKAVVISVNGYKNSTTSDKQKELYDLALKTQTKDIIEKTKFHPLSTLGLVNTEDIEVKLPEKSTKNLQQQIEKLENELEGIIKDLVTSETVIERHFKRLTNFHDKLKKSLSKAIKPKPNWSVKKLIEDLKKNEVIEHDFTASNKIGTKTNQAFIEKFCDEE